MNKPENFSVKNLVSAEEWQLRRELAACYRLVAQHGWDDLIFTHISVRIPGDEHHFLINPFGLLFEEITASSLVKIDLQGVPVLDTPYMVNPAGFVIHGAIHQAREDALCVLHTHTREGMAVSVQKEGLLPLTQTACSVYGDVAYHDYEGIVLDEDERKRLIPNVGTSNNVILRNHGLMTLGATVGDAYLRMFSLQKACETQLLAQAAGSDLINVTPDTSSKVWNQVNGTMGFAAQLNWHAAMRKVERDFPGFDD